MEPPADPSPASGTELEQLEKEQALGETANLGCPRAETPNAIAATVSSSPSNISGETATSGGSQTTAIPTTIQRGPTRALTTEAPGGTTAIETQTGKTGERAGKTGERAGKTGERRGRSTGQKVGDNIPSHDEWLPDEKRREEHEENHSVCDGFRDDAWFAWRMFLVGI